MSDHLKHILPVLVIAALAQCSLLATGDGDPAENALAAGACLAVIALPAVFYRRVSERTVTMLFVTGAVGGLGMLVGALIDKSLGAPLPCCHGVSAGAGSVFNWMNGLMLTACISGCWILCPRCRDRRHEFLSHLTCALGMCVGMILGGRLLGSLWQTPLGADGGMHVAMLIGMLAGVAAIELHVPVSGPNEVEP